MLQPQQNLPGAEKPVKWQEQHTPRWRRQQPTDLHEIALIPDIDYRSISNTRTSSSHETVTRQVIECRCGKAQGIYAIHDSTMTGN